jgi:hypothetical protein
LGNSSRLKDSLISICRYSVLLVFQSTEVGGKLKG